MSNFDEAVSGEVVTKVVSTDVVEFKEATILQAISEGGELDFLTEQLREKVVTFEHDLSTGVGRKRSASFAHNISRAKTKVIKFAKSTIAEDEAKIKKVKSSLKNVSADFDELRDAARLPLTEWEAEDARLKAEEAARLEAEKLLAQFNNDHEMGLLLDDKFDRDLIEAMAAEYEAAKEHEAAQERYRIAEEKARIGRDARIAQEAADKAIADAEAKATQEAERVKLDKFNSDHEIALLTNNKMIADAEKIASDARAKVKAEQDEKNRIAAAEQAIIGVETAAENARLAEVKRQEDEAKRLATEQAEREANKQNRLKKHKAAKKDLMEILGLNDKLATSVVQGVSMGLIANITIKY